MKAIALIALSIGSAIWYGWVFLVLWNWFAVPTFAAPALTIPQALGLALIVRMLTYVVPGQKQDDNAWVWSLVSGYVYPLVCLGLGWIYSWFL